MEINDDIEYWRTARFDRVLEKFFMERLEFIRENKYPAMLSTDPPSRFIMYLIPDKFEEISLEIKALDKFENHFVPYGVPPETVLPDYNFDGMLFYSTIHEKKAYTQVFRDARCETVAAIAHAVRQSQGSYISLLTLQKKALSCLKNHLSVLHHFFVPGPYYLFIRFLSVGNLRLDPNELLACGYEAKGKNKPLIRDELIFPPFKLEHSQVNLNEVLAPIFDILWNTFGFKSAPTSN